MPCPHCGQEHSPNAKFCAVTGRPMQQAPAPPPPAEEYRPPPAPSPPVNEPPPPPPPPGPGQGGQWSATPGPRDFGTIVKDSLDLYGKHFLNLILIAAVVMLPAVLIRGCAAALIQMPVMVAGGAAGEIEKVGKDLEARGKRIDELTRRAGESGLSASDKAELDRLLAEQLRGGVDAAHHAAGMAGVAVSGFLAWILAILALSVGTALVFSIAMPLAQAAILVYVAGTASGRVVSWTAAWNGAFHRLGPLLGTNLLAALAVFVGSLFCVVPGVILGFLFLFASPVVMLERRSGVDALKRSFELVKGDLVNCLLLALCFVAVGVVTGYAGRFATFDSPFFGSLVGGVLQIAALPLPIIATLFTYVEARRKTDGFDLNALGSEYVHLAG